MLQRTIILLLLGPVVFGYITDDMTYKDVPGYEKEDFLDDGVVTPAGKIVGKTSWFGGQVAREYLGIPYAKPPVGDLRYRKPEPAEPWDGTLMADTMPPACVQHSQKNFPWYDSNDGKSEDCLYLNVWTGRYPPSLARTPILFWIYGGEYTVGSNRLDATNGRGFSVLSRLVVVSPNYRVGAMGFYSSGTDDAPGNVGIHDIIMALEWVHTNIGAMGGDPDRIMIVGEGSGAETVGLFLLSPLTKGLFAKAVMQSGSFLKTPGVDPNEHNLRVGQELAEALNCASDAKTLKDKPDEVTQCMRAVDANDLAVAVSHLDPILSSSFLPQHGDEFLPKNPLEILKSGDFQAVPLLIGVNGDEGSYILTAYEEEHLGLFGEKGDTITKSHGVDVLNRMFSNFPDPKLVVEQYLGDVKEGDSKRIRHQVYTAAGDYNITCPTVYFAELYGTGHNTLEFYVYVHKPTNSSFANWMGIAHYDEVASILGRPLEGYDYHRLQKEEEEGKGDEAHWSLRMISFWRDFFVKGEAMPDWKNYSSSHHQYRFVAPRALRKMVGPGPHLDNCNFFRKYFDL